MNVFSLCLLDDSLADGDVSRVWAVWSGAVESALVDVYRFSGGPLPSRGLVLGKGRASFLVGKLGGHTVRKARGNAADAHDAADVFLYRDSSIAPLLDMRRALKAVMELLDPMIRCGLLSCLLSKPFCSNVVLLTRTTSLRS